MNVQWAWYTHSWRGSVTDHRLCPRERPGETATEHSGSSECRKACAWMFSKTPGCLTRLVWGPEKVCATLSGCESMNNCVICLWGEFWRLPFSPTKHSWEEKTEKKKESENVQKMVHFILSQFYYDVWDLGHFCHWKVGNKWVGHSSLDHKIFYRLHRCF